MFRRLKIFFKWLLYAFVAFLHSWLLNKKICGLCGASKIFRQENSKCFIFNKMIMWHYHEFNAILDAFKTSKIAISVELCKKMVQTMFMKKIARNHHPQILQISTTMVIRQKLRFKSLKKIPAETRIEPFSKSRTTSAFEQK